MIAEKILKKAVKGIEFCDEGKSLDDYLDKLNCDKKIRAKISSVLFTYFRKKLSVEYIIKQFVERRIKNKVSHILAIATTQILYQDSIEPETAVYVAVNYGKKRMGQSTGGFINAVLRKVTANSENIEEILYAADFYTRNNIPAFVLDRWRKTYSENEINSLLEIIKKPGDEIYFRILRKLEQSQLIENARKISIKNFNSKFIFYKAADVHKLINSSDLKEGRVYIQDPATSLAASAINFEGKGKILDGCSAPGGKTIMLAELFPDSIIYAVDRSEKRLHKVRVNIRKTGFKNITIKVADMLNSGFNESEFDIVFLDVPCSNSGVLRKRPDALWRLTESSLNGITKLQSKILESAKKTVKLGGKLVYSTCSIEFDENSQQIENFLKNNHNFKLEFEQQLLPGENNDGAYAAIMKKEI